MILNEKLFLNEKFGNIPNWLKPSLQYSADRYSIPNEDIGLYYITPKQRRAVDSGRFGVPHKVKDLSDEEIRKYSKSYRDDSAITDDDVKKAYEKYRKNSASREYGSRRKPLYKERKSGDRFVKSKDRYDNVQDTVWVPDIQYTKRYNNALGYSDSKRGLFNNLMNYGLDPANLEVIEEPLPTSTRDKHLKDPYLPVFLLVDKTRTDNHIQQVYIKGINDEELNKALRGSKYGDQLKKIPMKDLIDPNNCARFAYIDTTNKNNWLDEDKLKQRDEYFDSIPTKRYAAQYPTIDKSGNLPSDLGNRFDLVKLKSNKIKEKIKHVAEKSSDLYRRSKDLIKYISWTDTNVDLRDFSKIEDMEKELKEISTFASKLLVIDPNKDDLPSDYDDENNYYKYIEINPNRTKGYEKFVKGNYYINDINRYLSNLKRYEKEIKKYEEELKDEEDFGELDWE